MLTALLSYAAFLAAAPSSISHVTDAIAPSDDDAPALAAQAIADAERVLAVHAIPGAVVFDLDRAGELFQLTVSLDDDGAVVATAIDWRGPAAAEGGVAPGDAALLGRIERIDGGGGAALVLHDGAARATFAISDG